MAVVQFKLPTPITLAEAIQRFESGALKYRNLSGLVRKNCVLSDDGGSPGESISGIRRPRQNVSTAANGPNG